MKFRMKSRLAVIAALLMPVAALAHPGHEQSGFTAGVMHPLSGIDHLAAMIAVGLWAAQLGGRLRWAVPLSFVSLMLIGAALGLSGWQFGAVEQGIAASVCVLGLLLAGAVRLPAVVCVALTGAFATFHGYAHGVEAPAASMTGYISGFAVSTVALHGVGLLAAALLVRGQQPQVLRWAGSVVAVGGVALLAV